jgi:integrase
MAARRPKGDGTVFYSRSAGVWVARLPVPRHVARSGHLERKAPTQRAARAKLAQLKREQEQAPPAAGARRPLAEFLAAWLAEAVRPQRKPATAARYARMVREHLAPLLGEHALGDLTAHHVQVALNGLAASGRSPATVRLARAVLRAALEDAVRWELVPRNVAALTRGPRVERAEVLPMTVALAVGLRRGELVALRWADVDLAAGRLGVRETIDRVEGRLRSGAPKSAAGRRSIALPDVCVEALREHRARQAVERRLAGERWREHGLVFASTIGTPLEPRNLLRHCQETCAGLGLPRFTIRQLRHTAATFLLAQGVPLKVVQAILGHSQLALTADVYTHVTPELHAEAAARQDALLRRLGAVSGGLATGRSAADDGEGSGEGQAADRATAR